MPKYFALFSTLSQPGQIRDIVLDVQFPLDSEERIDRFKWRIADQYYGDSRSIILHNFQELTPAPAEQHPVRIVIETDQVHLVSGHTGQRIDLMGSLEVIHYLHTKGYLSEVQIDDLRQKGENAHGPL